MAHDEALAERIRAGLRGQAGVSERRMFGGLAFMVGGHLALSASGRGGLLVRTDPTRDDALHNERGAEPFVMRGRPMDGWLRVAPDGLQAPGALERWIEVGVGYARSLPPRPSPPVRS